MSERLKEILNPRDARILDAKIQDNWTPKEPRELLLPYMGEKPVEEESDIETRRAKAKEVYDGYGEIINKTQELRQQIADTCKDVTITLNPSTELRVMDAVKRVFGTDGKQITFKMYQEAVHKLAELGTESIPKLGEKQ